MTKTEFLENLSRALTHSGTPDAADIVEEYRQHFTFKLADGYSEEEIAARLGAPEEIAAQYETASGKPDGGKKGLAMVGLGVADFFFGVLCVLLWAWGTVMCVLTLGSGILGVCLMGSLWRGPMPVLPQHCGIVLGVAFAALAVLTLVGAVYFFGFVRQLIRAFGRFHKNTLASASGGAVLPALPVYPQFSAKSKRRLRRTGLVSAVIFAACFVMGFVLCAISAGAVEFWHTWGWFGYGR